MRTTENRPVTPNKIQLSAGQSHYLWSERDAVLLMEAGCVRLRESQEWLSESLFRTMATLCEGQHYQIERSGWICLYATHSAEVLHYERVRPRYLSLSFIAGLFAASARGLRALKAQLHASR